jgi:sugar phosphate isomerase/epimerase
MAPASINRRSFLAAAGVAAAGHATHRPVPQGERAGAPASVFLRLGAPVSEPSGDPELLARAHVAKGYRAAYCPNLDLADRERIRATTEAFARHDVVIAEVGRWVNLLDSDPAARRKNLATVTEGLALAEAIGARCCVDIAGSFSPTSWFGPHPENLSERFFEAAVENARAIVDAVKPKRARFCYEMMAWSLPDSPEACLRMVRAVDRPAFAVHLDPCNLVNSPQRFYRSSDLIRECYAKLAPWIASVHVKDLTWDVEMAVHFREVRAGLGNVDLAALLTEHGRHAPDAPLMLEHLPAEADYDAARDHLRGLGARLGLRLG